MFPTATDVKVMSLYAGNSGYVIKMNIKSYRIAFSVLVSLSDTVV